MGHTKGEWKILWGNYTHFATINKDISTRICALEIDNPNEIKEQTANAKLIAAAPDLLECLEAIMPHVKGNDIYTEAEEGSLVWKCKQAINKARGK